MKTAISLLLALFAAAELSAADLSISDARVRETLPGQAISAGYLTLVNQGAADCQLLAVTSPVAPRIEMHEHSHHHGQMRMRAVAALSLPAGQSLTFESGGYHLMLLDLPAPLRPGESVTLRFDFGPCGALEEAFPVVAVTDG
ncbi:MAG: copper chaperone PCu(A)C [Porticoccaceae bacterium]